MKNRSPEDMNARIVISIMPSGQRIAHPRRSAQRLQTGKRPATGTGLYDSRKEIYATGLAPRKIRPVVAMGWKPSIIVG